MQSLRLCLLAAVSACAGVLSTVAQQRREPDTGTVTGRVTCADTNGPARMASVVLIPVEDTSFLPDPKRKSADQPHEPSTHVIKTGLDGRFVIPKVPVGSYYLVATKHGYLQPLSMLKREQLNKPDSATAALMARLLTPVAVAANRGADVEARIYRGATLLGSVHYDDGSPAIAAGMLLFQKDKDGKWQKFSGRPIDESSAKLTDEQGNFRLTGLPAGEYLIAVNLELEDLFVNHLFAESGGSSSSTRYALDVFYGDSYRKRNAKAIKVGEGETTADLDIRVRVGEMHTLSGSVTDSSGHVVNAARIALLWKDDGSQLVSTEVEGGDNGFHFDYVPDGEYTLRVSNARDVVRTDVPNCPGCMPPFHTDEKTVRSFGTAEQPVVLHTDMQAVIVTVPAVADAKTSPTP